VLRTRLDRAGSFRDLLVQVREQTSEDLERQHVPLAVLLKRLNPPHSPDHAPLFQIMLVLQNNEAAVLDLDGLDVTSLHSPDVGAQAELLLDAVEKDGELVLRWRYNTGLFERHTIIGLAAEFDQLLTDLSSTADARTAPLDRAGKPASAADMPEDLQDDERFLVRLRQNPGSAPPVIALPGVLGLGESFAQLSSHFPDRCFSAVSIADLVRGHDSDLDATTLADRCAGLIAATTGGPVHLVGHSYGGSLAFHTAERLRHRGIPVAGLVLLDALDPAALTKALSGGHDDQLLAFLTTLGGLFPDLAEHQGVDLRRLVATESPASILHRVQEIIGPHAVEFFRGGLQTAFGIYRRLCDLHWPAIGPAGTPTLLVRASRPDGRAGAADSGGWAPHLTGTLHVEDIDADHEGMLRNPHARRLAGILHRFLAEHDGGPDVSKPGSRPVPQRASTSR
jgi:thioesterase domain-containing protein